MSFQTNEVPSLKILFSDVIAKVENLGHNKRPKDEYEDLLRSLHICSELTHELGVFSENETYDDIQTAHLRYLLIPYYTAFVIMNLYNILDYDDIAKKLESLKTAHFNYDKFIKFLTPLKNFKDVFKTYEPGKNVDAFSARINKIENYKKKRQYLELEQEQELLINTADPDEEVVRAHYTTKLINKIFLAFEQIEFILNEISFLEYKLTDLSNPKTAPVAPNPPPIAAPKFIHISPPEKQTVIDSVFKYDVNLPTMSVEAYLERYFAINNTLVSPEPQTVNNDNDTDPADVKIDQQRRWDDYKDTHPTGWGNRYNKG